MAAFYVQDEGVFCAAWSHAYVLTSQDLKASIHKAKRISEPVSLYLLQIISHAVADGSDVTSSEVLLEYVVSHCVKFKRGGLPPLLVQKL